MALEKEIIARVHAALESGDRDQEEYYKSLLGDLTFRKFNGLIDQSELISSNETKAAEIKEKYTRFPELPPISDPSIFSLVSKVNPIFGVLDDNCSFRS